MKFDIARAWKDEAYRQSLSEEELKALPLCPAGELSDQELTAIAGGNGEFLNEFGAGVGGTSSSAARADHSHSWVVAVCDLNVFSNDVAVLALQNVLNIGSPRCQTCIHAG